MKAYRPIDANTSRRELLKAVGMISAGTVALGALAACGTSAPSANTITSDVNLIAAGIGTLVAALGSANITVPQSVLDGIQSAVADIKANAAQISGAVAGGAGSLVGNIMNGLSTLTNLLSPFFPQASLAYTILSAAVSLGQYVYNTIRGISTGAPASEMAIAPGVRPLMHMTPDEARSTLAGAARQF